jgi:hypothetical protein
VSASFRPMSRDGAVLGGYSTSQRAAAQWLDNHARRWVQPPELATAVQVRELRAEVGAIKRLRSGEQIP